VVQAAVVQAPVAPGVHAAAGQGEIGLGEEHLAGDGVEPLETI
jgi:hypothetical protein